MKINELLKINLDEEINTVVDLDTDPSEAVLKEGLDSFVLTNSLAKHLSDFLEEFNGGSMQSGVWLSGFYGSGKSYFAQIIGLLLQNRNILGTPMRDRFSVKLDGLPNEQLLRSELGSLNRFNNIVVSFDASKHNNTNGLPYMIFSSFLRKLGMSDTWHGIIEYDLYLEGRRAEFLAAITQQTGKEWSEVVTSNTELVKAFKPALMSMGYSEDEYKELKNLADTTREEYDASRLQQDLLRYLNQNPDTRIVFFIDEVSEAITQKKIRLDDLEGVAEALAVLDRKVWTVAIAQQRLDDVLKVENIAANSLTKVRDRFRTKVAIEADEVDTIIRHRLLDKDDTGRTLLRDYFAENDGTIADVTNIGVPSLKKTEDADTYADYYPFYMHQFKLLQYFLFGTSELTQTRVGNRGMIISAFDVLKKEVKHCTVSDHFHVNATQLCNQADDRVEEALSNRYRQADAALANEDYEYVSGKKLLQTINFLTRSGVTRTTADNIAKSYINRPESYHDILHEIKQALNILQRAQIVILTGEQYRITNEAEQRILDDMRRFDVQTYEMISDVNNVLKKRDIVKWSSLLNVNGMNIRFKVATADGEVYANPDENHMSVIFSDLLSSPGCDDNAFVEGVRRDTADTKGRITLIPTVKYRNEIKELVTELRRLKYISEKNNLTDEEKLIVKSLCSEMDAKNTLLIELIEKSFTEGIAIYCFNRFVLSPETWKAVISDQQEKMFENIYTKRLNAELSDSMAMGVFTRQPQQLHSYFGTSPDFKFFDTSGAFIGANLSVVTEILGVASAFISGKDLEMKLAGPPTGYSLGTIMTTLAALFRGDKVIVKFNGDEYTSSRREGANDPFKNSRNFAKASFKAVSQSLSYKQRREIVDILKDDCSYVKNTGDQINYQLNDFEIVDAIRTLSRAMISKINNKIEPDDDYREMFRVSIAARQIFQQYQGAVTEANFLRTATNFLVDANTEEFIKAVERVNSDIKFIDEKMREIRDMEGYLREVKDQFEKALGSTAEIDAKYDDFFARYSNDVVHNFKVMKQDAQDITDAYIASFKKYAKTTQDEYKQLVEKAAELRDKLSAYPREWNSRLWSDLQRFESRCQTYTNISINFDKYAVKSLRSRLDLREVVNAHENVKALDTKIMVWETEIVTVDPNPAPEPKPDPNPDPNPQPKPDPKPQPKPEPKVRKLKNQLPNGEISVNDYRNWLKQQLLALNSFGANDKITLSE